MNDNNSDNVISLAHRGRPLKEVEAETELAIQEEATKREEITQSSNAKAKAAQLDVLDQLRKLVETDRINSFLIIGKAPNGAFLTEMAFAGVIQPDFTHSYIGAMDALKLELVETAQGMPQMLLDGTIVASSQIAENLV